MATKNNNKQNTEKTGNKKRAKAPAKKVKKTAAKVSAVAKKPKTKAKPAAQAWKKAGKAPFRIIPLGGMKEIGKNCTLIECNDEILIIDCGLAFPEYEMFGIDIVIPDFTYLKENSEKVKGLDRKSVV